MRLPAGIIAVVLVALWSGPVLAGETRYTNAKGQYVGKKDDAGRIIDAKGQVRGKEDEKGMMYDDKWRYQGKFERKNQKATRSVSVTGGHMR